jgi:hypothetical protein
MALANKELILTQKHCANLLVCTRHKYAVMDLLQLKTNADLVQYAIKYRIISV